MNTMRVTKADRSRNQMGNTLHGNMYSAPLLLGLASNRARPGDGWMENYERKADNFEIWIFFEIEFRCKSK
jgi:hypothetical protein